MPLDNLPGVSEWENAHRSGQATLQSGDPVIGRSKKELCSAER
jgi:hypothetical protein